MRIDEAEFLHDGVLRQHVDLPGDVDGGHIAEEQRIPPAEIALGKAVGREGAGQQLDERDDDGELEAVEGEQRKGDLLPDGEVVLPVEGLGDPADGHRKDLGAELEGRREHPHQRQQRDDGDEDAHDIQRRQAYGVLFLVGHSGRPLYIKSLNFFSTRNCTSVMAPTMMNRITAAADAPP